MKKILAALLISVPGWLCAQDGFIQEGEFGVGLGAAHYFGDLNTKAKLNAPKLAANIFFRKNLGNYIALRIGGTFAQLGYSDKYNTHNQFMLSRNLSFNTKIWELALQGDFNFYRFMPGDPYYAFTPYMTVGVSLFNYDPYAYLGDEKYFLRPLGTEGQGDPAYPDRQQYSTIGMAIPFGVGIKYAFNDRINLGFEVLHRFTDTDYLDDVSKTYPDPAVFPNNPDGTRSPGYLLYDRSYAVGPRIGVKDRQRGNSQNKDQFATAILYISWNLQSYRCPTAN
ncbi:MAG: DUF6089 family protein [Flavisolibacter sp.]